LFEQRFPLQDSGGEELHVVLRGIKEKIGHLGERCKSSIIQLLVASRAGARPHTNGGQGTQSGKPFPGVVVCTLCRRYCTPLFLNGRLWRKGRGKPGLCAREKG